MQKQVLTTAEAAKLLGVSVRTAQLLIENGPLRSWKTPGGHRRVYLADVMAYMTQHPRSSEIASSLAILVASPARRHLFDSLLGSVGECLVETCSDTHVAAFAIGARLPAAVVVDTNDHADERRAFLRQMSSHPELGTTRFIEVADSDSPRVREHERVLITTRDELAKALRAVFTPASPQPPVMAAEGFLFPVASNEHQRLAALERTALLGTSHEAAFDRLTWLASHHLHMPISLMTLLSSSHQHFKSRVGLDLTETPRAWAMCNQTILQRHVYEVPDLAKSPLFSSNPAVAGPPHFRFYAGAPVFDPDGFALGSICVMDYEPRELDEDDEETLLTLANIASDSIRARRSQRVARQ